jgi:regulator of replication initiation timing
MLEMFEKLINEHGSSTILKERIELINDKYEILETKLANSEKENDLLKQEVESLKDKLSTQKLEQSFVEYMGVKFKRKPSGGFEKAAYCQKCNGGMFALDPSMPFVCGACGSTAGFNGGQLSKVLSEATSEYT